ncbi:ATP-binding protein [Kurthia senegalensis]|uniref:ATP-binding protein n=1 Tax=Kurthia senegalensis TaxID=1033740 RepID=UPI000289F28D|nr:ATP-binding protein [Kurthia senegalensis]
MIVYALNGPSGTGKSTAALGYAYEHQIEGIIDDGLYIYKGKNKQVRPQSLKKYD